MKTSFPPGTLLGPLPVVMVSCGEFEGESNIITVAWTGIINSEPPLTYVSIRKSRASHEIIKDKGEFVINLTTEALTKLTDFCGVKSGRELDKFQLEGLTKGKAEKVSCPIIMESPVNIECRVVKIEEFPSHDMFVGEIINVNVNSDLIDKNGKFHMEKAGLIAYIHGGYYPTSSKPLGSFGFSVMKKKTLKKRKGQIREGQRRRT